MLVVEDDNNGLTSVNVHVNELLKACQKEDIYVHIVKQQSDKSVKLSLEVCKNKKMLKK